MDIAEDRSFQTMIFPQVSFNDILGLQLSLVKCYAGLLHDRPMPSVLVCNVAAEMQLSTTCCCRSCCLHSSRHWSRPNWTFTPLSGVITMHGQWFMMHGSVFMSHDSYHVPWNLKKTLRSWSILLSSLQVRWYILSAIDDQKMSALHFAIIHNNDEVAAFLIENTTKIDDVTWKDLWGFTPLHYAGINGAVDVVQQLFYSRGKMNQ
jgi:hypothetical protein